MCEAAKFNSDAIRVGNGRDGLEPFWVLHAAPRVSILGAFSAKYTATSFVPIRMFPRRCTQTGTSSHFYTRCHWARNTSQTNIPLQANTLKLPGRKWLRIRETAARRANYEKSEDHCCPRRLHLVSRLLLFNCENLRASRHAPFVGRCIAVLGHHHPETWRHRMHQWPERS